MASELAVMVLAGGMGRRMSPGKAPPAARPMALRAKGVPALYTATCIDGQDWSYLGLKVRNMARFNEQAHTAIPLIIMTSFWTHDAITEDLAARSCYGMPPEDIILMRQRDIGRVIPRLNDFDSQLRDMVSPTSVQQWRELCERDAGVPLSSELGIGSRAPAGTLDAITESLANGTLVDLWKRGCRRIFVCPINNPAARFDEDFMVIMGHFIDKGYDVLFEVVERQPGLPYLGEPGEPLAITANDQSMLVTRERLPDGVTADDISLIGTGSYYFRLDALFRMVGLAPIDVDGLIALPKSEVVNRLSPLVETFAAAFPFYPLFEPTIPGADRISELEYPNVHFERYINDITTMPGLACSGLQVSSI